MSQRSGKQSRLAAEEILRFAQNDERGTRLIGVILTVLLAISMVPVSGIQTAFADEPVERPATTGGDATLEGYAAETAPAATQREDGMYVADGLIYTVTDGGLSLIGFDGLPQGEDALKEIVVPEAVSVDGKDTAVVSVAIAEGNVAESVVSLTLPQSINSVDTAALAAAFPNLASVEVASPKASSAPVAAGAAAMKAAYSSFGGILYKNVRTATESDASQTTLTKELVWAPPATVVARIPVECDSIAPGAFADVKDLKTVVCFGVMEDIPQAQKAEDGTMTPGAFTDEQIQTVNVIVPQTGTVVSDSDRISADVAVTDDSTMDIKRNAWWQSGFASDRITLGEVYGSTTNTLPVTEGGVLETAEAEVAYAPETTQNSSSRKAGIEPPESAIPTPVPDDDEPDSSESGLVFTHLADMTLSVGWKGDPTATPSHLDIPAYATINGVTYPVTEIAPHAFEGAVFLTSVTIPGGVTTIGDSAFANCVNLMDIDLLLSSQIMKSTAFGNCAELLKFAEANDVLTQTFTSEGNGDHASPLLSSEATDMDVSGELHSAYDVFDADTLSDELLAYALDSSCITIVADFGSVDITSGIAGSSWLNATKKDRYWVSSLSSSDVSSLKVTSLQGSTGTSSGGSHVSVPVSYKESGSSSYKGPFNIYYAGPTAATDFLGWDASYTGNVSVGTSGIEVLPGGMLLLRAIYKPSGIASTSQLSDSAMQSRVKSWTGSANHITKSVNDLVNYTTTTSLKSALRVGDSFGNNAVKSDLTSDEMRERVVTWAGAGFGTISYMGVDDEELSVYPTTYRQGGTPALPVPRKEGLEFLGWTWSGQSDPTTDAATIKGAFAGSGAVTLTANWGEPAARYFYTDDSPYKNGSDPHTIAVKLTNDKGSFTKATLTFAKKDDAPVADASGVMFSTTDGSGTAVLGSADTVTANLVEVDGGWGVRVTVTVDAGALAPAVASYTDASYVASLAKMSYTFA